VPTSLSRYQVGREKIREFARAIGETHPLHFELEAARAAGYRDLVAPPMFVSVYAGPVFREALWSPALGVDRRLTVHGGQEFEWTAPVIAGDELTTVARSVSEESKAAGRFIVIETTTTNQVGQPVTIGRWTVVVRPAPGTLPDGSGQATAATGTGG
jgi:acyl dehydratase